MALHRLRAVQHVGLALEEAWAFFADPRNLAVITPPWMDFTIRGDVPETMYEGMLIEYAVRPLLHLPVRWVSEITHVEDRRYFIDEQRSGPYRLWHHEHHLREVPGGVEVRDLVSYTLPFGPVGDLMNRFLVRDRLREIFGYRRKVLAERFGVVPGD